jgi:hypothetical protein
MKILFPFTFLVCIFAVSGSKAQSGDRVLPYSKIYSRCLDADVKSALALAGQAKSDMLNENDTQFIKEIEARFSQGTDASSFLEKRKSPVDKVLKIYRDYWRVSLLNPNHSYDSMLMRSLSLRLSQEFGLQTKSNILSKDSLHFYLKKYVLDRGFSTTGFSKTGKLFDLLVWKSENDTTYNFSIGNETINSRVVFMEDFVTLGWEEYATMDRYYPGGWATQDALYCVKKAYDLKSEGFLISYLCHEARHFSDYKLFPKLSSADLEYRAKLTELSMLKEDLYKTINSFIDNSNVDSQNAHPLANYYVVRNLSNTLFESEFERDIGKWKKTKVKKIQRASSKLLISNTKELNRRGKDVEEHIKKT